MKRFNMEITFEDFCDKIRGCRYSEYLINVLGKLGVASILELNYEDDYQGFVSVHALLKNGRIFVYSYNYGSCSGCDEWEAREMEGEKFDIEDEMLNDAVFYNQENYEKYLNTLKSNDEI